MTGPPAPTPCTPAPACHPGFSHDFHKEGDRPKETEDIRIGVKEANAAFESGDAVFIDARSPDAWAASDLQIPTSIRITKEEILDKLEKVPRNKEVIAYCT